MLLLLQIHYILHCAVCVKVIFLTLSYLIFNLQQSIFEKKKLSFNNLYRWIEDDLYHNSGMKYILFLLKMPMHNSLAAAYLSS